MVRKTKRVLAIISVMTFMMVTTCSFAASNGMYVSSEDMELIRQFLQSQQGSSFNTNSTPVITYSEPITSNCETCEEDSYEQEDYEDYGEDTNYEGKQGQDLTFAPYEVNGQTADTLAEAVQKAECGSTINLIMNTTDSSAVTINKNITLDLGEFSIERKKNTILVEPGWTLTIKSSGLGSLIMQDNVILITNNGTVNAKGGELVNNCQSESENLKYVHVISNRGTLNLDGATCIAYGNTLSTVFNADGATLNIKSGTITAHKSMAVSEYNGIINMSGGQINGNTYGIYNRPNRTSGEITITGGEINSKLKNAIKNYSDMTISNAQVTSCAPKENDYAAISNIGNLTIKAGTEIYSKTNTGVTNYKKTLTVEGGTITGNGKYGISNKIGGGTANITGGTIKGIVGGMRNVGKGTANISGGNISGNYGVRNISDCTMNITGGTIKGSIKNAVTNYGKMTINGNSVSITSKATDDYAAISNRGDLTVKSGTIYSENNTGITNYTKTLTITGGKITGNGYHGVSNLGSGTVTIKGGTIAGNGTKSSKGYGARNIKNGKLYVSEDANLSGSTAKTYKATKI